VRIRTNRPAGEAAPAGAKAPSPLRSAGALDKAMADGSPMECGGNDAALACHALGSVPEDPPSSEMAEQIELPEGWRIRRLGELIARPQYGLTASAMDDPSGPRFLRITDIQESGVDWTTVPSCDCDKATLERLKLLPGDVVVARIGATTGKAHLIRDRVNAVFASYLIRLRANDGLEPEFLDCFTNSAAYWRQIDAVKGGRLKQGVNIPLLESLELALPPLPEQWAIAAVLRTVQGAKEACERVLAATRQLKQSLLHNLFTYGPVPFSRAAHVLLKETEIGPMPDHWEVERLDAVMESMLGKMLSPKARTGKSPKPYLRNANVQWGRFDLTELYEMDFADDDYARYGLLPGDVLVCEGGEVGRTAIWRGEISECHYQKALHRLRPRGERMDAEFFAYHMFHAFQVRKSYGEVGTVTTIAHLPGVKLKTLPVPVPPLPEQREIARQLAAVDAKLAAEEARRSALAALFGSLLHRLLTGQVRVPLDCGGKRSATPLSPGAERLPRSL
jgi:type I restriction enzyme S subunit